MNVNKFAKELEIDRVNLYKIIKDYRAIPQARNGSFIQIMKKYARAHLLAYNILVVFVDEYRFADGFNNFIQKQNCHFSYFNTQWSCFYL